MKTEPTAKAESCVTDRYSLPMPVKQIAQMFGVHRNTASRYLHDGMIRAKRVGGRWRLHMEELPVDADQMQQTASNSYRMHQDALAQFWSM